MQAKDIMTKNPLCAQPSTSLQQVAQMMIDCDCGGIPVCESDKLVGFVTDRDIVCRILAKGQNPLEKTVQDAMTKDLHTVKPETNVDECARVMQRLKVRRLPVVDDQGKIVGIIAQADLARIAEQQPQMKEEVEETVAEISEPRVSM